MLGESVSSVLPDDAHDVDRQLGVRVVAAAATGPGAAAVTRERSARVVQECLVDADELPAGGGASVTAVGASQRMSSPIGASTSPRKSSQL